MDPSPSSAAPLPVVMLTNDDGPPSKDESPFIHSFSQTLIHSFLRDQAQNLKVVIPDSQKSWIGKSYLIQELISAKLYDPLRQSVIEPPQEKAQQQHPDQNGTSSSSSSHLWYLINGTPSTCSNIGLYNLFRGSIDLVISGPNLGRNTSSAFSLSSGTVGAAMDAAITNHKAIALSYAIFERPVSDAIVEAAHSIAVRIIQRLWLSGFDKSPDGDHPDLYSVNIPLVPGILSDVKVMWTFESHTRYARLFLPLVNRSGSTSAPTQPVEIDELSHQSNPPEGESTSPDHSNSSSECPSSDYPANVINDRVKATTASTKPLKFVFKPDISALIDPNSSHHPPGSDAWALNRGYCTVTPLKAAFKDAPPPVWDQTQIDSDGFNIWKL